MKVIEGKIDTGINNYKDIDRIMMKKIDLEIMDESEKAVFEEINCPYLPDKDYDSESDDYDQESSNKLVLK